MPTVTIDAYFTGYEERSDLAYGVPEWGTNRFGKVSHAWEPGDGAQWDATRVNQFFYGAQTEALKTVPGIRAYPSFAYEGPHMTGGLFVFCPPVAGAVSSAVFSFFSQGKLSTALQRASDDTAYLKLYAVAADNFVSRWVGCMYPTTYKQEFSQHQNGAGGRKWRVDSYQAEQEHTESECLFTAVGNASQGWISTPDISDVLNEVFDRPGWASGNRLALVLQADMVASATPFAPDWSVYGGGDPVYLGGCGGAKGTSTPPDRSLSPQLTLTY